MNEEEIQQHLSNALEELRLCVTAVGNDEEQRTLLYHAGRTINALMCLRHKPTSPISPAQAVFTHCNVCGHVLVRADELAAGMCAICANEEMPEE